LTFDLNGGNISGVTTDVTVQGSVGGVLLENAPTPTLASNVFVGWTSDEANENDLSLEDVISSAVTSYAKYEAA